MTAIALKPRSDFDVVLDEVAVWVACDSDPVRTLTNIACLIGNQFRCDACSLYFLDPATRTLVLSGTVGLRQECVGQIRMRLDEGLTGLVAEQRRPVVVTSHAAAHPRFRYFPEAGEDLYESFLGTPIDDGGELIGVLVLQTFETATFDAADVARMSIAGRRLGPELSRLREPALEQLRASPAA